MVHILSYEPNLVTSVDVSLDFDLEVIHRSEQVACCHLRGLRG